MHTGVEVLPSPPRMNKLVTTSIWGSNLPIISRLFGAYHHSFDALQHTLPKNTDGHRVIHQHF